MRMRRLSSGILVIFWKAASTLYFLFGKEINSTRPPAASTLLMAAALALWT